MTESSEWAPFGVISGGFVTWTTDFTPGALGSLSGRLVAAPEVALLVDGQQSAPLTTGRLSGRRARHAGRLRVARLRRRVARREGRPAHTVRVQVYVPRARLEAA